jgi:hypothetical protein
MVVPRPEEEILAELRAEQARDRVSPHCRLPQRPRQNPATLPARESASSVVDAATIIPSTDSGVSAATHPGWPCNSTSRRM